MAIVVVASLAFSLVEAFFVLPAHLASNSVLSVKKDGSLAAKFRGRVYKIIDFMRYTLYGRALKWTMQYRVISIAMLIAIFPILGGLFAGGFIKATFFPNIPFASFNINIVFKPGTPEAKVKEFLIDFEDKVWEVNDDLKREYNDSIDYIRFTFSGTGTTMDGSDQGSHAGGINIFHKELDDTEIDSYDLIDRIRDKIGEVPEAEKFIVGAANYWGKPVAVSLKSKKVEDLEKAKEELKDALLQMSDLTDVTDNASIGQRELELKLKPLAYHLGLTQSDITQQIRQGFFGEEIQRLQVNTDETWSAETPTLLFRAPFVLDYAAGGGGNPNYDISPSGNRSALRCCGPLVRAIAIGTRHIV